MLSKDLKIFLIKKKKNFAPLATLFVSYNGEINLDEVFGYFQKFFKNEARGVRESLIKLAENSPGWEFSGSTDNIFKMSKDLFHFFPKPFDRASMIGIQGGSGKEVFFC